MIPVRPSDKSEDKSLHAWAGELGSLKPVLIIKVCILEYFKSRDIYTIYGRENIFQPDCYFLFFCIGAGNNSGLIYLSDLLSLRGDHSFELVHRYYTWLSAMVGHMFFCQGMHTDKQI